MLKESFDIGLDKFNYKKVKKDEFENCKNNFLITFPQVEKTTFSNKQLKECYYLYDVDEFLVFIFERNGYFEPHFANLTKKEFDKDVKGDNSIKVFSFIFNLMLEKIKKRRYTIILLSPNKDRTRIYLRIIDKILNKYQLNFDVYVREIDGEEDIIIEPKSREWREEYRMLNKNNFNMF